PHDHAGQAPRAHTVFPRPRRQTDHASRTPRTCVRGTATAAKQSHPGHLALPHRAPARSSAVERNAATNEAAKAECSHPRSGATPASAAPTGAVIPGRFVSQCSSGAEVVAPTAAETKGSSKTRDREGLRAHVRHLSRTVPLTVKLRGRAEAPDKRRGRTLSFSARGAQPPTVHGPLQRLLDARNYAPKTYGSHRSRLSSLRISLADIPSRRDRLQSCHRRMSRLTISTRRAAPRST